MKKFLFALLIATSFSCFASEIDNAKNISEKLLKNTSITDYYKSPKCNNLLNLLKTSPSEYQSLSNADSQFDITALYYGFVMGIYEKDPDCIKNIDWQKENADTFIARAFWSVYGDGKEAKEKRIDYALDNNIIFQKWLMSQDSISFLLGYFYATGNQKIIDNFHYVIQQAKKEHCFNSVIYTRHDCPTEEMLELTKEMIENNYAPLRRQEDLEILEKAKTEECIQQLQEDKEGQCPEQMALYAVAKFLEKYDTDWYNQNIKEWLPKKESFYQKEMEKERIESEKRRIQYQKEREAKNVILVDGESFKLSELEENKTENLKECVSQKDCISLGQHFHCNQKHSSIGKSYCLKAEPKTFKINNTTYYKDSAQDQLKRCPQGRNPDDVLSGCWTNACNYTYQAAKNYCESLGKELLSQSELLNNCEEFSKLVLTDTDFDKKIWTKEITPIWINKNADQLCSLFSHERSDGFCPTGKIICK